MSQLIVKGGKRLQGEIKIAGNKNSALKLMAASLIGDSPSTITNVPRIKDVQTMGELITDLGAKVEGLGTPQITIDPSGLSSYELDPDLSGRIRASVVLAAPLLARFGKAVLTPPGGDQIGERVLDTHFAMMRDMGVEIVKTNSSFELTWKRKKSADCVFLEEASVTATEMWIILSSVLKQKEIKLENAACEPHVRDLALFVSGMGAKVVGAGTNELRITGSGHLKGVEHEVINDHIEGGTFAILGAITGGDILVQGVNPNDYKMILIYLSKMGVNFTFEAKRGLRIRPSKLVAKSRKFKTQPWPGFPTDLMSPFIVLATQTQGTTLCHDWMYEWRIFFVDDLISMGANILIADPHRVVVTGPTTLIGTHLVSKDIRAGISIILASLVAQGESVIDNVEVVDRGYERISERLGSLGADIKRVGSA